MKEMTEDKRMTTTATIMIGNSDNKLTQERWSEFCKGLKDLCESYEDLVIHFASACNGDAPWQNYCIVIQTDEDVLFWLKRELIHLRNKYNQDSIALVSGITEFLGNELEA